MKKTNNIGKVCLGLFFVFLLYSCNQVGNQNNTHEIEKLQTENSSLNLTDTLEKLQNEEIVINKKDSTEKVMYYECPKTCKGIFFKAPGECPVCKEDLIIVSLDTLNVEHTK